MAAAFGVFVTPDGKGRRKGTKIMSSGRRRLYRGAAILAGMEQLFDFIVVV